MWLRKVCAPFDNRWWWDPKCRTGTTVRPQLRKPQDRSMTSERNWKSGWLREGASDRGVLPSINAGGGIRISVRGLPQAPRLRNTPDRSMASEANGSGLWLRGLRFFGGRVKLRSSRNTFHRMLLRHRHTQSQPNKALHADTLQPAASGRVASFALRRLAVKCG